MYVYIYIQYTYIFVYWVCFNLLIQLFIVNRCLTMYPLEKVFLLIQLFIVHRCLIDNIYIYILGKLLGHLDMWSFTVVGMTWRQWQFFVLFLVSSLLCYVFSVFGSLFENYFFLKLIQYMICGRRCSEHIVVAMGEMIALVIFSLMSGIHLSRIL